MLQTEIETRLTLRQSNILPNIYIYSMIILKYEVLDDSVSRV